MSSAVEQQTLINGVVVALPEELATLTSSRLARGQQVQLSPNLWVAYGGAGYANAERAAQALVAHGVQRLISWGCAAALSPELKAGDLVIAESVQIDNRVLTVDHLPPASIAGHRGRLLHSADLVDCAERKRQLFAETGAVALDMESAAIVDVAVQNHKSVWVLRSISDTADFDLPPAVTQALNAEGEVELYRLLWHLLLHPAQLPQLIKLGRGFKAAQDVLRSALPLLQTP